MDGATRALRTARSRSACSARSAERIEGEHAGVVERERSALLPCLGKSSLVELRPDGAQGFLVEPLGEGVRIEPHLLLASHRAGEDAGGCGRSPLDGEDAGKGAQVLRGSRGNAVVAVDA